jgi:hypothetical protein
MMFAADLPTWASLAHAVARLSSDSERDWGTMTSAQMLRHVNGFCDLYAGNVPVSWRVRFVAGLVGKRFLRRVAAKSPTATPRNMTTLPALRAKPDLGVDFDDEKAKFLAHASWFSQLENRGGVAHHPMYGDMSVADMSGLVRHHTAHHFHQFRLLSSE